MRDLLTGLAIILIVVLTTMLVAPYFVDWTSQRGFLEARLSHALGQKVTIGGAIDLKLLPTPYLVLDQVVVGGDDGPVRIGIHHLDLELTVAPLLHGEFDIVEARLEEPTIRINLEHDRTLPALPAAPAFQAAVHFDRIQVSDGTLAVADPQSGRTFVFDHLDLDADAGSFTGPFKVRGTEGADGAKTKFHLATTTALNGKARARLVIEETGTHAALDLDGTLDLAGAGNTIHQSFDGNLALSGHLSSAADTPIAWTLTGAVKANPRQATIDGGEFRLGSEDAGVTLKADAHAELDDQATLALDLSAKQLDLDRLSGAPIDTVKPAPPKLPDLDSLRRIFAAAAPSIPTKVDLAVDNATYGGETLSALAAHFGLDDSAQQPVKLSGDGPGGAHIAIDGQLNAGSTFVGTVDVEAANLPRTLGWFGTVAPSFAWQPDDLPFKAVKLAGHIKADQAMIVGDALALTFDRSRLSGTGRLALGDSSTTAKLTADLVADALDIDGLPSLDAFGAGSNALDLDLRLEAKAIRVSRLGDGALAAGHIRLAIAKTGRRVDLTDFRAEDLGGATIQATGSLDPEQASFAMTLDAAHLEAATALVRQLAPGPIAEALVDRAPAQAPAKLKIDGSFPTKDGGTLVPTRLSVAGTLGATRIYATAKPDTGRPDTTIIAASLMAPDGGPLLSQLGLPALPMDVIGPSRVTLSATGQAGQPLDTTVAAALGATRIDVTGRFDLLSAAPTGSGTLHLQSPDLTPLLQTLAVAFPDMTGRIPADITSALTLDKSGTTLGHLDGRVADTATRGTLRYQQASSAQPSLTGALDLDRLSLASLFGLSLGPPQAVVGDAVWSREPFAVGLVDPPSGALTLKAKILDIAPGIEASNGSLDLGIAPNVVMLDNIAADLSGGRIDGGVTLRRDGRQATLESRIALERVDIRSAAFESRLTAKLDVVGGGASSLALVASLAGSGEATATDLVIPGGDPSALPKIFGDVESDALAVDQDAVIRAFGEAAAGPLAAGTRHFDLSLASGVIRLAPKDADQDQNKAKDGPVSSKVDAAFDLTRSQLEAHIEETLNALPKGWTGPPPAIVLTFAGALDHAPRTVDVSGFINAVSARALARETARIEAYEFDIRERAFFNARLQSERRREEERQKVEADARKAEAERKAAEAERKAAEAERKARVEAARIERARKEQAATQAERAARDRELHPAPNQGAPPADAGEQPPAGSSSPPPTSDPSALGRY